MSREIIEAAKAKLAARPDNKILDAIKIVDGAIARFLLPAITII